MNPDLTANARSDLRVLIVEDDPEVADHVDALLRGWGYDSRTALSGRAASEVRRTWMPDVALVDLHLPDINGMDLLRELRAERPPIRTVVISGHPSVPIAVKAVESGAMVFLEKPVSPITLRSVLELAERQRGPHEHAAVRADDVTRLGQLVSRSPRMQEAFDLIQCVAPTDANVLICGENGTGKELVANALHDLSRRAGRPFIKVNCAAIPDELIEAEFFGHRRGAFTGAVANRVGLFEAASGGTLLLDEVGEMPPHLQIKLLRVLQERQARPVGGSHLVALDFRLICATNCDLRAATDEERFRQDLYFRINTVTINLPPLRDRPEDIPLLTEHFLRQCAARHHRPTLALHEQAREAMLRHTWRGNVRELEHAIERAVILSRNGVIALGDLPESLQPEYRPPTRAASEPPMLPLAELERLAIVRALEHTRGNKRAAAALLGVYRPTLYSKLRKYGIIDSPPGRPLAHPLDE